MSFYFEENEWGERFIPDVNRDVFLRTRSSEYFEHHLELDLDSQNTLHVVVGSDSGLLVKYLLENLSGEGSCAVIIEDDEIFPLVEEECRNLLAQLESEDSAVLRVMLISASEWQSSSLSEEYNAWFLGGNVNLTQANCCETDYDNRYYSIFRDSRLSIVEHRIKLKQALGNQRFLEMQLDNAADNVSPCPASRDFGKNRVAVILSGGPSLNEHMDWITSNREKLFLIAVSRLCGKLQSIDLKPDLVVAIDPHWYMYDVSKEGTLWTDVPLISSYHLTPELLQQWQGPHFFIGDRLPWERFTDRPAPQVVSTGPTVGHTAVIVASQLGFTTILMAGVDLCYNVLGNTHTDGTPEAALRSLPSGYDAQVETYSGRIAGTGMHLLRTINALEDLGKAVNQYAPVLFNLSTDAAKIDSIPYVDRNDIQLAGDRPEFDSSSKCGSMLQSLEVLDKELHSANKAYREIITLCKKAFKCIDHIYERKGKRADASHHRRLSSIERKLENQYAVHVNTLKYFASYDFVKLQLPSGFGSMSKDQLEDWIRTYYSLMRDSASVLLELVKRAQEKSSLRRDEQLSDHDLSDLVERWKHDNTPGRILSYKGQHGASMSESQLELAQSEIERYLDSMQKREKNLKKVIASDSRLVNDCIKTVVFLFQKEKIEELEFLSSSITNLDWPNNALVQFTNGLTAELAGDRGSAASSYQSVVDLCSDKLHGVSVDMPTIVHLIETTLTRLTQTYLADNNGQSALEALGILSEMCPHYVCSYTKLLTMLDHNANAIELLKLYLENYPRDWRAAYQLSECYLKQGETESAELARQQAENTRSQNKLDHRKAA